jgi:hypothetical protein
MKTMKTMKIIKSRKTITKNQYYQLLALQALSKKYNDLISDILTSAVEITGEENEDHTADMIFGETSLDDALDYMDILIQEKEQ